MARLARCCCGSLQADAVADPVFVAACHCTECQRRTGAAFGVGAYFRRADVSTDGPSTTYVRDGQEGRKLRFHFCPTCGTSVYWFADLRPDLIGIAIGAFADPSSPSQRGQCGSARGIPGSPSTMCLTIFPKRFRPHGHSSDRGQIVENQQQPLYEAARFGLSIAAIYRDDGISATTQDRAK